MKAGPSLHLASSHGARLPLAVEQDEAFNPVQVRCLSPEAVVPRAQALPDLFEQPGRLSKSRIYVRARRAFRFLIHCFQ